MKGAQAAKKITFPEGMTRNKARGKEKTQKKKKGEKKNKKEKKKKKILYRVVTFSTPGNRQITEI